MQRLLIAEDDAGLRDALRELLTAEGFEIEVVGDVAEAVRAIEREMFDVVLSDVRMPGDGSALPGLIRRIRPTTPVILMSAVDAPRLRERAVADGVVAWLKKPLSLEDLLGALRQATAGKA
jgi:DNA-binding NtrC family response regulator